MTQRPSDPDDVARWTRVDRYLETQLPPEAPVHAEALARARSGGLPDIQVSPLQGRFLAVLVRATGARNVLEIGTLGGTSGIWMARALPPDGRLVTLEIDPRHAEVARANFRAAGVEDRTELRVGPALATLDALIAVGGPPFDLAFVDADKASYPEYLDRCRRLLRDGGLIVADNVVRRGDVADPSSVDASVAGVRRMLSGFGSAEDADATVLQTVGPKGHDGMAFVVVHRPTEDRTRMRAPRRKGK